MGAHFERGGVLFHLGRMADAAEAFMAELQVSPNSVPAFSARASALLNLGCLETSEADIRAALAINPQFAFAHYLLSYVWQRRRRDSNALEAVNEAIRLEQNPLYFQRLGELQAANGDFDSCLASIAEALALDPRNEDSLLIQAKALEATQRPEEAREVLRRALTVAPEHPSFHQALGQVTLRLNQPEAAIEHFREARRISPNLHNDPDALAAAYGRRVWIFKKIGFLIKTYCDATPLGRWITQAVGGTIIMVLPLVVRSPTEELPIASILLGILGANAFLFFHEFREWTIMLGRLIARRDLNLRRRSLFNKSLAPAGLLFRMHLVFTMIGAAIGAALFVGPFLAAFLLPFPLFMQLEQRRGFAKWLLLPMAVVVGFALAAGGCVEIFRWPMGGLLCWAGTLMLSFFGCKLISSEKRPTEVK